MGGHANDRRHHRDLRPPIGEVLDRLDHPILRPMVLLVPFVLVVTVWFARPWLESPMFAPGVGRRADAGTAAADRHGDAVARRHPARRPPSDRRASRRHARSRRHGRPVRHLDARGAESERVFRLAHLDSRFESGIESPLDDAILAFRDLDIAARRKIDEVPFDFERRRVSVSVADPSVIHEAVREGRRTLHDVTEYILMGSGSNFGNMSSMVDAALFLPMLPTRVLLTNLLHVPRRPGCRRSTTSRKRLCNGRSTGI
jgi:hypothetical protein